MDIQKDKIVKVKKLSHDSNYYNNVFKKTERILSATFYIVAQTTTTVSNEIHLDSVKDKALELHEIVLHSLELESSEELFGLERLQYALVALESVLTMATVSRVITEESHLLLTEQIDAVQRYLNNHFLQKNQGLNLDQLAADTTQKRGSGKSPARTPRPTAPRQKRVNIPAGDISTDAYLVYSQLNDRADRIKTILEAKPQATIKDISEVITDVSEKTIQRELNSLIEKGQVIREGERRWSRYSVRK